MIMLVMKKIHTVDDSLRDIVCSSCLLPMQYQRKENNRLIWQCFKCGKFYLLPIMSFSTDSGTETWSPPK